MSSATNLPPDPLPGYTLQQRQELCEEVINAEVFQYVPITATENIPKAAPDDAILENFQRTASTPSDPDPVTLRYTDAFTTFRPFGFLDNVNMFPYVYSEDVKWYVTYGFKEGQLFLIEEKRSKAKNRRKHLNVTALIEPNLSIDLSNVQQQLRYIRNKKIEEIASKTIKADDVPDDLKLKKRLTLLGGQDYFRLCGSVLEILSSPRWGFFGYNLTKSVNYVRNRLSSKGLKNMSKEPFQVKVDDEWVHIKPEAFVTCCVSRHVFGVLREYQFFLLANPETLDSVFVFREVLANNPNELQFLASVHNVASLRDRDDFGKPADTPADAGPSYDLLSGVGNT